MENAELVRWIARNALILWINAQAVRMVLCLIAIISAVIALVRPAWELVRINARHAMMDLCLLIINVLLARHLARNARKDRRPTAQTASTGWF